MLVIYGTEFRFKYLRHFTRLTSRCSAEVGYYFMYTEPEWRFKKSVKKVEAVSTPIIL